jgi:BASS family bile acid:Na+ symporter
MIQRFLLVWLILLSTLAYGWAKWLPDFWNPFEATAPGLGYLFAVTMLAIGSLLPRDEIRQIARRWPMVLGGTAIQYITMPLLAFGLGQLFGLKDASLTGIVLVGCVPGAMASNVLTLVARGNVSYSVSLTTSATLLSPLVVPLALWLTLRRTVEFPVGKTMWELCWMVVLPVVLGHLLSVRFAAWRAAARRGGAIVANLAILWIIAVVVAGNADTLPGLPGRLLLALLALNLGGYLAGAIGGRVLRLPTPMRRALTLEIGMQNAGLGATLALRLFGDKSTEAIAPAIYTFGCMLTGTLLARLWAELGQREPETAA